jgi:hypothetical protein
MTPKPGNLPPGTGRPRSASAPEPFNLFEDDKKFIREKRIAGQPEYVELHLDEKELALLCAKGFAELPLLIDTRSAQAFDLGITDNYFCGIVRVSTSTIYLCPLVPNQGGPPYPAHVRAFSAAGVPATPIDHVQVQVRLQTGSGKPSHLTLAERLGIDPSDCVGFTVVKTAGGQGRIHSFTSRSINGNSFKQKVEYDSYAKNASQQLLLGALTQRAQRTAAAAAAASSSSSSTATSATSAGGGTNHHGEVSEEWAIRIAVTITNYFHAGRPRSSSAPPPMSQKPS